MNFYAVVVEHGLTYKQIDPQISLLYQGLCLEFSDHTFVGAVIDLFSSIKTSLSICTFIDSVWHHGLLQGSYKVVQQFCPFGHKIV